jgi:hypothetical protein
MRISARAPAACLAALLLSVPVLASCDGVGKPGVTARPERPCCHLLVTKISPTTTTNLATEESIREGPGKTAAWSMLATTFPDTTASFPAADVDELAIAGGLHEIHVVYVVGPNLGQLPFVGGVAPGSIAHAVQSYDGGWSAFFLPNRLVTTGQPGGPLGGDLGRQASFLRVSTASVKFELNVCAVEAQGQLEHAIRASVPTPSDGSTIPESRRWEIGWTDVERAGAGEKGKFVDVGCAGVYNPATNAEELHICGVTDNGHLWHSIVTGTSYAPFGDVEGQAGEKGDFVAVDCAPNASQLHLVAVNKDGRVFHTVRIASGTLSPFEDVLNASAAPFSYLGKARDVAIGFCNAGIPTDGSDLSQLNVVTTGDDVLHTIYSVNKVDWGGLAGERHWMPQVSLASKTGMGNGNWFGFSVASRPFFPGPPAPSPSPTSSP